jgi:hypothetical protein
MNIKLNHENGNATWEYENKTYSFPAEDAFEYGGYIYISAYSGNNELSHTVTNLKGEKVLSYTSHTLTMYLNGNGNDFPLKNIQSTIMRGDDICIMMKNEILIFTRGTENVQRLVPPTGYQFYYFKYEDELKVVCTDINGGSDMQFRYVHPTNSWEKLAIAY